ncbi:MAG: PAS domain S-box protein [Deltaproteobacteria bacterium]|jgi:PAS domain S-box-containing protein|nr:PAS domain S-box protein [Deltaproteobacteria bacterium]MDA8305887.1 PAS domain S-box protein [Deltaproteobacteria bacterium]
MHYHALIDLIRNSALLIALSALYSLLARFRKKGELLFKVLIGLLFGCAAVAGMQMPFHPSPGIIYDGRSIVLAMAGLFGGATTAAVSAVLAGIYRAYAGGAGVWAGLAAIALCPSIGLTFRRIYNNRPDTMGPISLYGLGLITQLVVLACQLLLPLPAAYEVIRRIWFSILLVLPVATLLCGILIRTEEQRVLLEQSLWKSREDYRITIDSIGDAVMYTDNEGLITGMNRVAGSLTAWTPTEAMGRPLEDIFRIVNEQTRNVVESPVPRVLREGVVVGLANHTILLARDGREVPIADSGAPIRNEQGDIQGVVLVFRDQTDERAAQRFTRAHIQLIEYSALHSWDEFLRKALDEIAAFVDSPIGFYHAVESDQKTFALQQWPTSTMNEFCGAEGEGLHYSIDRAGVWADCLRERKPVIYNDYNSLEHEKGMPEGHPGVVRILAAPVMREERIVAILGVGNKPADYTEKDAEAVAFLADAMWEIVERKRAEEVRREREEINNAILNQAIEGIVLVDSETLRFAEFNDAACNALGYSREEFARLKLWDIQGSLTQEEFAQRFRSVVETGHGRFENRQRRKDGSLRDVLVSNRIIDIHGHKYGVGVWLDITERKQMEEALRDSETRFRNILYTTNEGFWMIDNSTATMDVNPRMCAILGRDREEILGRKIFDFVDDQNRAVFEQHLEIRAQGRPGVYEIALCRPDGSHVFCRFSATPIFDGSGVKIGSFAMVTDITERKQAEMELLRAKTEWERTFDSVPELISIIDTRYRIVRVNKAMAQKFGLAPEQCIGMRCFELVHDTSRPPESCPHALLFADGLEHVAEVHDERMGCDFLVSATPLLDDNGVLVGSVHTARDVTGQKTLEMQVRQTQKMEALGTLAGGIAHDFNNILAIIMGYTDIALLEQREHTPVYDALQNVLKATSRAKDLVTQILAFSRKSDRERKPIEARFIVKEAVKLLRASIPTTIQIRAALDSDGLVVADPTEIQQVVMNLCANASHAMRDKGGVLGLNLDSVYLGADQGLERRGLQPGPHLRLTVSDTGRGIRPQFIERIFEPYFTTKGPGEGTGMGLALVHGIVKSLGGAIEVYSREGQGTTFQVFLPMISLKIKETKNASPTQLPQGNKERILFVDDEHAIADLGEKMLTRLGYQVTVSTSSLEALELFRNKPDMFDLLISDQTMPNMTGVDLAREVRRIRKDIPVIICTGYSERLTEEKAKELGISALVMKPFAIEHLASIIRKSLQEK